MPDLIPPQAIDVEQAVLGACMISEDALIAVEGIIKESVFYLTRHADIYRAILSCNKNHESVDILTVTEELRKDNMLDKIGGTDYLMELTESCHAPANAPRHARILLDYKMRRQYISQLSGIINNAYELTTNADEITSQIEQAVNAVSGLRGGNQYESMLIVVNEAFSSIKVDGAMQGVKTGYCDLDKMTGGLQDSDLIILAAKTSVGKTALALNIAGNVALRNRQAVGIFSLEMARRQLGLRILSSDSGVNWYDLRSGRLQSEDWDKLRDSVSRLGDSKIYIDDSAGISIPEIRAKAWKMKREHGISLLIIDYLQLIKPDPSAKTREQEVSGISRGLKLIAKELNIPVVALSQLHRAVGDGRPGLSSLRDSGAIEQDADVVLFLHPKADCNEVDLIIGKQRNGPTGDIPLLFDKSITQFKSMDTEHEAPESGRDKQYKDDDDNTIPF